MATPAFKAGPVDECRLFILPIALGGASQGCRPTYALISGS
ncbi:hypothetical protein AB0J90_02270 [Micromonospora sp. NPDC049523]